MVKLLKLSCSTDFRVCTSLTFLNHRSKYFGVVMSGSGVQLSDEDARKLLMSLSPKMLEQITQLQHQRQGDARDQARPPEFPFLKIN